MTLYVFHFQTDGQIYRIPEARWQRIWQRDEAFHGHENQTERIAYAYVELAQRRPLFCHRVQGFHYRFDNQGKLDRAFLNAFIQSPLDMLPVKTKRSDSVVFDAKARFMIRRYQHMCTWTLSKEEMGKVVEFIW